MWDIKLNRFSSGSCRGVMMYSGTVRRTTIRSQRITYAGHENTFILCLTLFLDAINERRHIVIAIKARAGLSTHTSKHFVVFFCFFLL